MTLLALAWVVRSPRISLGCQIINGYNKTERCGRANTMLYDPERATVAVS